VSDKAAEAASQPVHAKVPRGSTDETADSIYFDDGSNILFASMKYVGYDYAGDMERMRENPKVREWWAMTDGWQESLVPGAVNSESGEPSWWKPVEEVFYLA
jgi:L-rhamnose mutarotase